MVTWKYVQAKIPADLHRKVKLAAVREDISLNELIRELLENWLKEQEKKPE